MMTDTAGNPIYAVPAYCGTCGGPTDTAGQCPKQSCAREWEGKLAEAHGKLANANVGQLQLAKLLDDREAELERLRGLIEQADIEGWTVKGLKGAIAARRGEGEK